MDLLRANVKHTGDQTDMRRYDDCRCGLDKRSPTYRIPTLTLQIHTDTVMFAGLSQNSLKQSNQDKDKSSAFNIKTPNLNLICLAGLYCVFLLCLGLVNRAVRREKCHIPHKVVRPKWNTIPHRAVFKSSALHRVWVPFGAYTRPWNTQGPVCLQAERERGLF